MIFSECHKLIYSNLRPYIFRKKVLRRSIYNHLIKRASMIIFERLFIGTYFPHYFFDAHSIWIQYGLRDF